MTQETDAILKQVYNAMANGYTASTMGVGLSAINPTPTNTAYEAGSVGGTQKGFVSEVISKVLADKVRDKHVFRQFAAVYSTTLEKTDGSSTYLSRKPYLDFDRQGTGGMYINRFDIVGDRFGVGSAPNNSDSYTRVDPTAKLTYDAFLVQVREHALAASITETLIADTSYDVMSIIINDLGEAFIEEQDVECARALIKPTDTTATGVRYVTHKSGGGYDTGYWNTVDVSYGTVGSETVTAVGELDVNMINFAKMNTMFKYNYNADTLFIEPEQWTQLMSSCNSNGIAQFLNAGVYGNQTPLVRGEIGMISNIRIVNTNSIQKAYLSPGRIPPVAVAGTADSGSGATPATLGHQAILIDSKHAFGIVSKAPLKIRSQFDLADRAYLILANARYAVERMDDGAVVLLNTV